MWRFDNIKKGTLETRPLYPALKAYIREKDLNFIIAGGRCLNLRQKDLAPGKLDRWLDEFSYCTVSMVNWTDDRPSPPFLAADEDGAARIARVTFLIDLTREADDGRASSFYSKMLGALATQFFAGRPEIDRLWFPFFLEGTAARGGTLEDTDGGTAVVRQ